MLKTIKTKILSFLLFKANNIEKENFNEIKLNILQNYGSYQYNDLQIIPGKSCNFCNGEKEVWNEGPNGQRVFGRCRTCGGTTYIIEPIYNIIGVYNINGKEISAITKTYNTMDGLQERFENVYRRNNITNVSFIGKICYIILNKIYGK